MTFVSYQGNGDSAQNNPWRKVNVGNTERSLSAIGGAVLVIYGLVMRGRLNPGLALLAVEALYRGLTGHSFLYQALGINMAKSDPTVSDVPGKRGIRVRRAMTINRSAEDLFSFWIDVEKAPMYMNSIESVRKTGEYTSHWTAKDSPGNTVEWDSEVVQVNRPRLIAWQIKGTPKTASAGRVIFEPARNGRGTIMTLELDFLQGVGKAGKRFGKLSTMLPEVQTRETLRHFPERLRMAAEQSGAEVINYEGTDVVEELKQRTGGLGPDACIDAVGLESHGTTIAAKWGEAKQKMRLSTDRPNALYEAIQACGLGGTVSVPGVYAGFLDKFPFGVAFAKGLTFRMGQTNILHYLHDNSLLDRIQKGEIDPSYVITHRLSLDDAPHGYEIFKHKRDGSIKCILKP